MNLLWFIATFQWVGRNWNKTKMIYEQLKTMKTYSNPNLNSTQPQDNLNLLDSEGKGNGGEMAKLQISELPLFSGIIYSEIL